MKIGIYDRYANTMGGGEQHVGAFAEFYSQNGEEVDWLTCESVDKELISKKLNLDLSKVNFRVLPNAEDSRLEKYTKEYDLFINSTYSSRMKNHAKKSMLVIFFPIFKTNKFPLWIKKSLYSFLSVFFKDYDSSIYDEEGVYGYENMGGFFGRWVERKFSFKSRQSFQKLTIQYSYSLHIKFDDLKVEAKDIKNVIYEKNKFIIEFTKPLNEVEIKLDLQGYKKDDEITDPRDLGIFVNYFLFDFNNSFTKTALSLSSSSFFSRVFGRFFRKFYSQKEFFTFNDYVSTYDIVLPISEYTKSWVDKKLKVESTILYPPVNIDKFRAGNKKNIIMSVGRFFINAHNKKQLEMIRIFKKMYDENPEIKDYEYHLCGGTHKEKIHQKYLKQCMKEAEGYPIYIHPDIPFNEMSQLYSEAKIFWHATGLGENIELHPDKFEHFGITTVEAMSAGCVPVVIGKAGQKELVKDGIDGFLWENEDECIEKTLRVIRDDKLAVELSKNALVDCKKYSKDEFRKELKNITLKL